MKKFIKSLLIVSVSQVGLTFTANHPVGEPIESVLKIK